MAGRPKVATLKRMMNEDEVQTLLDYVRWKARGKAPVRYKTDRVWVETLLFSGLRNQELCDLNFNSLPAWHHSMVLEVANGKGGKARDVPIPEQLSELLTQYAIDVRGATQESPGDTPLFLGREYEYENGRERRRISPPGVVGRLKIAGARCAEQCLKPKSKFYGRPGQFIGKNYLWPHRLRFVAATRFYHQSGNDIRAAQKYLGHASVTTTQKYLDTGEEALAEIARGIYV